MMNQYLIRIAVTVTALMPLPAAAQEALVVLRSTVTGNQEQPKVLTIVPWQRPDGPSLLYQPVESLVGEVFAPIDREEFLREIQYRQQSSVVFSPSVTPDTTR
jgi:hypothetical protein